MDPARRTSILTALSLIALSGATLGLSERLSKLSKAYQELRRQATLPHRGFLLPTFTAGTVSGDSLVIGPPKGRQLIFEFNATCPYCRATLPTWKTLADSARRLPQGIQVLGISLDSVPRAREHVVAEQLAFPVVTFPTRKMRRLSRAGTLPQTLVLDDDGLVIYAHAGVVTPSVLDSIYQALVWKRPGSSDSATKAITAAASRRR